MVDIEQDRVKLPARLVRVESVDRLGAPEEIGLHKAGAPVAHEFGAQRDQTPLMPPDHRLQSIDDQERLDFAVLQSRDGRVSKSQPAHHDIPVRAFDLSQSKMSQLLLNLMEQARHQKGVAKLHLVNLDPT